MSCSATNFSSSFDSIDKFEIGQYDLTSAGSRSGFLSCGVINAALNAVGTTPCCNERLNSSTRNGASSSIFSLSRRVGRGSDSHCLSGSRRTAATTSTTVSGRKLRNAQACGAVENDGGGASAVDAASTTLLYG